MQLEVGKTYLNGTGGTVTITGFDPFLKKYFSEIHIPTSGGGTVKLCQYHFPSGQAAEPWYGDLVAEKPEPGPGMVPGTCACPLQHRIRTAAEVGLDDPALVQYGGKIASMIQPSPYAQDRIVYAVVGTDVLELMSEWIETTTLHSFPDTGCGKSWCRTCDAEGRFDWRSGKYYA